MQRNNYVIVDEGESRELKIDSKAQQTIYTATPLITCFAILFMWNEKAIIYHAPSGFVSPEILEKFSKKISEDKADLSKVDIVIACSDSIARAKNTLEDCLKNLKQANFTKPPIIKENQMCYSIDTLGSHAELVTKKVEKKPQEDTTLRKKFP